MRARRRISERARSFDAAERGRIVQKVLVERWTAAEAAAGFDLDESLVAAWVREYRRRGMASLREEGKRSPPFLRLALRAWRGFARLLAERVWQQRPRRLAEKSGSPEREPSARGDF